MKYSSLMKLLVNLGQEGVPGMQKRDERTKHVDACVAAFRAHLPSGADIDEILPRFRDTTVVFNLPAGVDLDIDQVSRSIRASCSFVRSVSPEVELRIAQ